MSKNIVLKYADVRNQSFLDTCQRMINSKLPFPVTLKLLNLAKVVNEERNNVNILVDKLLQEHSEEVPSEPGQAPEYKIKAASQAEFTKAFEGLMALTIETRLEKIEPALLSKLELSVNELLSIHHLLVGGEELAGLSSDAPTKEAPAKLAEAPKPPEASH